MLAHDAYVYILFSRALMLMRIADHSETATWSFELLTAVSTLKAV